MAFPKVEATNSSTDDATSHTVSLPASIVAGETLLVFFATDGANESITFPVGWTELTEGNDANSEASGAVAWRKADGTEGASITVTTTNAQKSSHCSYRISGAIDPTSTPPEFSTIAVDSSGYPDSSSLTPTGGSKDYLYISFFINDGNRTVSAYPWADNNLYATNASSLGCGAGVCSDEISAASADPGNFTLSAAESWAAWTLAVYPTPPKIEKKFYVSFG